MTIYDTLHDAGAFVASRRQAARAMGHEKEEKLWLYLRNLGSFVHVTGQVYRFEDFLARTSLTDPSRVSALLSAYENTLAREAAELLFRVLGEALEPEQKKHVLVLLALLKFVAETEQIDDVEDFFSNQQEYAPVAIAHFASHPEAEAWLGSVSEPPSPALILIGDEYHQFWYWREDKTHGMHRDYPIEPALEELVSRGVPPRTPSFPTRAEAEQWLMNHPADPYAFVVIAGECFFAVHHRRLRRHSLHHVASALKEWEERKRAVEREAALEAAAQASGGVGKEPQD